MPSVRLRGQLPAAVSERGAWRVPPFAYNCVLDIVPFDEEDESPFVGLLGVEAAA